MEQRSKTKKGDNMRKYDEYYGYILNFIEDYKNKFGESPSSREIESTIAEIENSRFQLEAFDDVLIRKLIECVKVISKTEIIIIFKGGYEVKAEVEKK